MRNPDVSHIDAMGRGGNEVIMFFCRVVWWSCGGIGVSAVWAALTRVSCKAKIVAEGMQLI